MTGILLLRSTDSQPQNLCLQTTASASNVQCMQPVLPTALRVQVGHSGGGLRVEHGGRSVTYEWGEEALAGEVLYAAFFGGCSHEVLPVTSGTRITLAYEFFASPGFASPGEGWVLGWLGKLSISYSEWL